MKKTLLALKGAPCSGKGEVAKELAARLGWPVLDKDDVLDVMRTEDPKRFRKERREAGAIAYEVIWRIATRQLDLGSSVIVDTPLPELRTYERARETADNAGALLLVVSMSLDEATWLARLESRERSDPETHKMKGRARAEDWTQRNPEYPIDPLHRVSVRTDTPELTKRDIETIVLPRLG